MTFFSSLQERRSIRSTPTGDGGRGGPNSSAPNSGGSAAGSGGPQPRELYTDAQQVFVGNLPHYCTEADLTSLFSHWGKVAEIRINNKGAAQSKAMPQGTR